VLYYTFIKLDAVGDTFLDMSKFGKGMVWVNGHNLGRYWKIGPQQTLYLPGCWLKKGDNEFLILDTMPTDTPEFRGVKEPVLDRIQSDLSLKHRLPGQNLDLTGETPAIKGTLPNADGWQTVKFDKPVRGRYICLEALSEQGGSTTMTSAAELIALDADGRDISRIGWSIVYADSEETDRENNGAEKLIDQQESTFWHSEWSTKQTPLPHSVVIDMAESKLVGGFRILPRTDRNSNGRIRDFRFFVKETPFKL
jgi:beta-galactosidase